MNQLDIYLVGSHYPGKIVRVTQEYLDSPETQKNIKELRDSMGRTISESKIVADIAMNDFIIVPDYSQPPVTQYSPDTIRGIVEEFACLKPSEEPESLTKFISKYGLLGISEVPPFEATNVLEEIDYFRASSDGVWWYEPLSVWNKHIGITKSLYSLYGDLIKIKKYGTRAVALIEKVNAIHTIKEFGKYYYLGDEKDTLGRLMVFESTNSTIVNEIYVERLGQCLQKLLRGGIDIDYTRFKKEPSSNIGFRFLSVYSTHFLIAAIYFDLWRMINAEESAHSCKYCGALIKNTPQGRVKEYCNGAHRVAHKRELDRQKLIASQKEGE